MQVTSRLLFYVLAVTALAPITATAQWHQLLEGGPFHGIVENNGELFVGVDESGQIDRDKIASYILHSSNDGLTWDSIAIPLPFQYRRFSNKLGELTATPTGLFVRTARGLFRMDRATRAWQLLDTVRPGSSKEVTAAEVDGPTIYVGQSDSLGSRLRRSTDEGRTWLPIFDSLPARVTVVRVHGSRIIVALEKGHGLLRTTDNGKTWNDVGVHMPKSWDISQVAFSDDTIVVGDVVRGLLRSTDNGYTWESLNNAASGWPGASELAALYGRNGDMIGGTYAGAFISRDAGHSWIEANEGLGGLLVKDVFLGSRFAFAVQEQWAFFRRPLSELFGTSDAPRAPFGAAALAVMRCIPNPSIEEMRINYRLDRPGIVDIRLFDVRGNEVRLQTKGWKEKGEHTEWLDTRSLAPGSYTCRLLHDGIAAIVRIVVIR
jgi:photosystem II stability/assembly factor-like uncharacterized protein